MKMISNTRRQNSLCLSGGHIISDSLTLPTYSPNNFSTVGQPFTWDDAIDDINTPDIDPSFFETGPFHKFSSQKSQSDQLDQIELMAAAEDALFLATADQNTSFTTSDDTNTEQSIQHSLEDNFDLSSLINQTTDSSMVTNIDIDNQYIPLTTSSELHYLEPRPVVSVASTVNIELINTPSIIDCLTSESPLASISTQSYSPLPSLPLLSQSYASPAPSPALSYTSTTSQSTLVSGNDYMTSDTNTIDSLMETKPEPEFLHPTDLINDHLYTRSQTSSKRKRSSNDSKQSPRLKNNVASKKSRVSKRDKQKELEEKERFFVEDNAKCKKLIEDMERQIQWCKDKLFKEVTGHRAPRT